MSTRPRWQFWNKSEPEQPGRMVTQLAELFERLLDSAQRGLEARDPVEALAKMGVRGMRRLAQCIDDPEREAFKRGRDAAEAARLANSTSGAMRPARGVGSNRCSCRNGLRWDR